MGARAKKNLCARGGMKSSLKRNFSASARKWVMPQALKGPMLARLGPSRSCIIDDCRRSSQVRMEAMPGPRASMKTSTLMMAATRLKPNCP
jgi:hypothetical protein